MNPSVLSQQAAELRALIGTGTATAAPAGTGTATAAQAAPAAPAAPEAAKAPAPLGPGGVAAPPPAAAPAPPAPAAPAPGTPPVEVEDEEEDAEEAGKAPSEGLALDENVLMNMIGNVVQQAVAAHLAPVTKALADLTEAQGVHLAASAEIGKALGAFARQPAVQPVQPGVAVANPQPQVIVGNPLGQRMAAPQQNGADGFSPSGEALKSFDNVFQAAGTELERERQIAPAAMANIVDCAAAETFKATGMWPITTMPQQIEAVKALYVAQAATGGFSQ